MKFYRTHIEIESDWFMCWQSKLMGLDGKGKAMALFPFIITISNMHPKIREGIINHELIHFAQEKEMLLVGFYLWHGLEWLYHRIIKGNSSRDTYILLSAEQEAYDNMWNSEYLITRKPYAHLRKYLRNKPVTWSSLMANNLQNEGFPIVYDWHDEAGIIYPLHKHQGKVAFYVVDGSVTFSGGINQTVSRGERIDVPPGVEHSAVVGSQGCDYVVGEEIEGDG